MTKPYKIALVNSSSFGRIFPEHVKRLEKIGEVKRFTVDQNIPGEELARLLDGYDLIISSVTPFFDKTFFENKDKLLLISRHGIGYNNIDLEAAKAHDTLVSIVSALVERDAVAENNVANLLALMRKTWQSATAARNDRWKERAQYVGHSLLHKKAGLIGIGNTGSLVAQILRGGFLCEVCAYDPNVDQLTMDTYGVKKVELDELLRTCDVICLCASLNEDNYHMLSFEEVEKMKNGVYISNSARGALVDEQAVVEGLESGKIAGFATDVLEVEPGHADHPYLRFDNVIVTPHTSAYTMECLENMGLKCVDDIEKAVRGECPDRAVQPVSSSVLPL